MPQILIADDSRFARRIAAAIVESHYPDWEIMEAVDGTEALQLLRDEDFDFATLDMNMPGHDGIEVKTLIDGEKPGVVAALVTANIQDSVREKAASLFVGFWRSQSPKKSFAHSWRSTLVPALEFTEEQRDTAAELFNIGMGKAAASLSRMLGDEIELSIPNLELLDRSQLVARFQERGILDTVSVCQQFSGSFSGSALLIFPHAESLELARILLQEEVELSRIGELEQDAVTEVGNVLLNACLGSLANLLGNELRCAPPDFGQCSLQELFQFGAVRRATMDEYLLFVEVGFAIRSRNIQGMVVFALPIESLTEFRSAIERLLNG